MSYARAAAKIIVDNAHCDGLLTTLGTGRDWDAKEPRDYLGAGQFTPDIGGEYGWHYAGQFENIQRLGCIAPIGSYTMANMALSGWTVNSGDWALTSTGGELNVALLHYKDARAGLYATTDHGDITSVASFAPNLMLRGWRMPPGNGETDPGLFEIILQGATSGDEYCLGFPREGSSGAYGTAQGRTGWQSGPYLLGKRTGDSTWTLIDNMRLGSGAKGAKGGPEYFGLRIESIDGALLIRSNEEQSPWIFTGTWRHPTDGDVQFALADSGPVQMIVMGQPMAIGMWQMAYPASAVLYPRAYYVRSTTPPESNTPNYKVIGNTPTGTSITPAIDTDSGNADAKRPAITMVSAAGKRPALYAVQEYRTATIAAGTSNPVELTNGEATFRTMALSGRMNHNWKNATVDINYEALPGQVLNEIRPNAKVIVATGAIAQGETDPVWNTHFTGYALPPKKQRQGAKNIGQVSCADIVQARLARKTMGWMCSLEGWPVDDAFEYILNRAGVPAALISIDAAVSLASMGALYYLPTSTYRGKRKLQFSPSTSVVKALDEICKLRNLQWGVDYLGILFLRPTPVHVTGHYDWTLSDTGTGINMIQNFWHERSLNDFANFLQVMVGEGVDAAARILVDDASWTTTTSARFIGDLWARYESYPSGDDLTSIVDKLWAEVTTRDSIIGWTEFDRPGILPGQEVIVTVDAGMNIQAGSIYRILTKAYQTRKDGRYQQDLEAELVEIGTS